MFANLIKESEIVYKDRVMHKLHFRKNTGEEDIISL